MPTAVTNPQIPQQLEEVFETILGKIRQRGINYDNIGEIFSTIQETSELIGCNPEEWAHQMLSYKCVRSNMILKNAQLAVGSPGKLPEKYIDEVLDAVVYGIAELYFLKKESK